MSTCKGDEKKVGYVSLKTAVMDLLRAQGDTKGRNLMRYMSVVKDVYIDLNFHVIKNTKRVFIEIDKRTRTINVPDDYLMFSSLCYEDACGHLEPLVINTNLKGDIVDISQDKDCHCECGCHSKECGIVQNYEVKYEYVAAVMPDGSRASFQAYTRLKINKDGSFVEEKNWPTAIYQDGVWTDTRLVTTEKFLCKLDVKPCGCIKDTPQNKQRIDKCCGAEFFPTDCGCTICEMPCGIPTYNYIESSRQIKLSSDFPTDRVLLRYYYDAPTGKLFIPVLGKRALHYGIVSAIAEFDRTETEYRIERLDKRYGREKTRLRKALDRFSIKAFYEYVLGRRVMP